MPVETPGTLDPERRRELHRHCYRMLGSITDAEDVLQETLVAAWRSGISDRAWLYKVATNRCLNAIRDGRRRPPVSPVPPFEAPEPSAANDVTWLQPDRTETIRLAFVAALQRLPPRQTAAILLCDVLDFSLRETAELLDTSPTAIKGLLQRARARLDEPAPPAANEPELAARFAEAFAADDIDTLLTLLTDDAWLAMPPAPHVYVGKPAIASFLRASAAFRTWRYTLTPVVMNGQPAFDMGPDGCVVIDTRPGGITAVTRFLPRVDTVSGTHGASHEDRRHDRARIA